MAIQANFPAIKPSLMLDFANTKQLDSRITYTRASTATFYNGVTTSMAEQNLLTYSQQFDNAAWVKTNATITADSTTAPDGTTTADTLTLDAGSALNKRAYQALTAVTAAFTVSIYAKTGTYNVLQIFTVGGSNSYANFDLTAGTVGTVGSGNTSSITSVGNGWYRCVLNLASVSSSNVNFAAVDSTSAGYAATTSATGTLFLWGAQLEQRSAVSAYTATTTQAITNYIPVLQTAASGVARFDNNPTTGESLGLLIEESRSNLFTYSSQFDNAAWTKTRSSITADTVVSPDGTLNGDKLVEDSTATNSHIVYQGYTITAGSPYVFSMYVKAAERTKISITFDSVVFPFDIGAGTSGSGNGTITAVGNSWYRITCLRSSITTASSFVFISLADSSGATSYTGNGFSGLFIWGAQLEAGAIATSYIPTVASQVTRAADAATMTGTNFSTWYNAGEGTLYSEAKLLAAPGGSSYPGIVKISTDSANKIGFWTIPAATSTYFSVSANSTSSADISVAQSPVSSFLKIAGVYKVNDFAASVNASTVGTDTSGIVPVVIKMDIGTYDNIWNGTIKKIAYYPLRVTNAQLQALTS